MLLSLCLLLTLTACASDPIVLNDPEILEFEKRVPVDVPAALLLPCAITALPRHGDTWEDVFSIMKAKDLEQLACNLRFTMIRDWQMDETTGDSDGSSRN